MSSDTEESHKSGEEEEENWSKEEDESYGEEYVEGSSINLNEQSGGEEGSPMPSFL